MKHIVRKLQSREMDAIMAIQHSMLRAIHECFHKKGFTQIMPVILSPLTDPLCHSVHDAEIGYYGQKLKLTKSMILHKQISLMGRRSAIYTVSPNIRLEMDDKGKTGRHLIEFSQVDFEIKGAKREDVMQFMEGLVKSVFRKVRKECGKELKLLKRELSVPKAPFKAYHTKEAEAKYGREFEAELSKQEKEPFWLLSHDREFYDREDVSKPGYYLNYDLVWPEGYGEALSGGEREFEHKRIVLRMKRRKMKLKAYRDYLKLAKMKALPQTAGAGFGVERMLRYICGKKHIEEVCLFPKVPGARIRL